MRLLGGALVGLGLTLAGAAGAAGVLARDHMAAAAGLCGPLVAHCSLCFVAGSLFLASLATVGAGMRVLLAKSAPALQRVTRL